MFVDRSYCQSFKFIISLKIKKLDNCNSDLKILFKISYWFCKLDSGGCTE